MPQSSTIRVPPISMRFAGLERPVPTRGPPLVPRTTMRVRGFAGVCAAAVAIPATAARPPRAESLRRSRRCSMLVSLLVLARRLCQSGGMAQGDAVALACGKVFGVAASHVNLIDHLVGPHQDASGDIEVERFGDLLIDSEFEHRR